MSGMTVGRGNELTGLAQRLAERLAYCDCRVYRFLYADLCRLLLLHTLTAELINTHRQELLSNTDHYSLTPIPYPLLNTPYLLHPIFTIHTIEQLRVKCFAQGVLPISSPTSELSLLNSLTLYPLCLVPYPLFHNPYIILPIPYPLHATLYTLCLFK